MFLGENLLAWLVLAIGGALAVGNALALIRPRTPSPGEDQGELLERPPLGRSLVMIAFGTLAAVWALASLISANETSPEPVATQIVEARSPMNAQAVDTSDGKREWLHVDTAQRYRR